MNDKQSPKVCPVTGMFLEEPDDNIAYWSVSVASEFAETSENGLQKHRWGKDALDRHFFYLGNCFATREDAERYAKHLKAMAKLRRLGGSNGVWWSHSSNVNSRWICHGIERSAYNQLTPEERNALLWPNEEE